MIQISDYVVEFLISKNIDTIFTLSAFAKLIEFIQNSTVKSPVPKLLAKYDTFK